MGDMAVSNSLGSNVFDILLGLSLPWFLKTGVAYAGTTVSFLYYSLKSVVLQYVSSTTASFLCNSKFIVLKYIESTTIILVYCNFLIYG